MDNEQGQKLPNTNPGIIFSGVLYGLAKADSTDQVGVGGMTIELRGEGSDLVSKTIVSGVGGEFTSGLIFPGKYKVYFSDPKNEYFHPPMPITLSQDANIPIYVYRAGEPGRRRKSKGQNFVSSIYGTVVSRKVVNKRREPLPGMKVRIKSIKLDSQEDTFSNRLTRTIFKTKPEEDIEIKRETNRLGMFYSGRTLPKGTYNIFCSDPSGNYLFSTQFIVLKKQLIHSLLFIGYTHEEFEEFKKTRGEKTTEEPTEHEATLERPPLENEAENEQPKEEVKKTETKREESSRVRTEPPGVVLNSESKPKNTNDASGVSSSQNITHTGAPVIPHATTSQRLEQTRQEAQASRTEEDFKKSENVSVRLPAIENWSGENSSSTFTNGLSQTTNTGYSPTSLPITSNRPAPGSYYTSGSPQAPRVAPSRQGRKGGLPGIANNLQSAVNNVNSATNTVSNLAGNVFSSRLKWYIGGAIAGIILVYFLFFGGGGSPLSLGGGGSNTSQNPTAPGGGGSCKSSGSLDYSIPFRNTTLTPQAADQIKKDVVSQFPNAQIQNWDNIVSQSVSNGWNPSFVLALWIEESGAQGASGYTDALGCDPTHPTQDINKSLSCLFNSFPAGAYPANSFEDFMCVYGGDGFHKAPCTFNTDNPNFPGNIKSWYSKLSSGGTAATSSDVTACSQPPSVSGGGWPTSGTLTQGPQGALDHAGIYSSTGHEAVDIADPSAPSIYSPFDGVVSAIHNCILSGDCSLHYGNSVSITTNSSSGSFTVLYGHFSNYTVSLGQEIKAGDKIGTMGTTGNSTGVHLHWEFQGLPMQPPNIPAAISPLNCDTPDIPCSPSPVSPSQNSSSPGV